MLAFGKANAKLVKLEQAMGRKVFTFSTLSGFCCPYAKECESRAIESNGKLHIEDGKHTLFRCFSASQEALFRNVYASRKRNWDMLLTTGNDASKMADMISASVPKKAGIIRINVAGDFFTKNNMLAWAMVAKNDPNRLYYAYTKSLPFWIAIKNEVPDNFILTASYGGWKDDLIAKHNLRYAKVVFSVDEANQLGLPIDSDDSHAARPDIRNDSFALLIHGAQPKGSEAGKAVRLLDGLGSYSKGK